MGGFVIETNPKDEQVLPNATMRVTLTVEGMKLLAIHAPNMILNLPTISDMIDKSKASSSTKLFACMQVI